MTALSIFESHQITTLYSRSHYTEALRRLVSEGRAAACFTDKRNHKVSVLLNEHCIIRM